jgi:hypothetical protein
MRWRATMCYARVSLSHRGARRSGSKTREIRPSWCETDASWTSIASACPSVQTGLAAPRSVYERYGLAANAIFSVALTFACWFSKHTYRATPRARREQTARLSRSETER